MYVCTVICEFNIVESTRFSKEMRDLYVKDEDKHLECSCCIRKIT